MAKTDRFMIAPINSGLQNDLESWLIPDDAFANLLNAYVFRGRVIKRFGTRLMNGAVSTLVAQQYSRLRVNIGTTAAITGNFALNPVPGNVQAIGQMFSVGNTMFTVYQANGATLTTGAATATFSTLTGALTITGNAENPLTAVYFYPSTPVMGLVTYEQERNTRIRSRICSHLWC